MAQDKDGNNGAIVRVERDGIEYFTVKATGESAVSQRGLAVLSGVAETSVRRWFVDLRHPEPKKTPEPIQDKGLDLRRETIPKWLEPLRGMALDLSHGEPILKNGKAIKPIPAATAFKFVSLVARNLKHDRAFETIDSIGAIGLESYIQGVTGWLPKQHQSSPEQRTALDRILNQPTAYRVLYDPVLYDKAVGFVGVGFYWKYCYDFLTLAERCKLNRVNEITPDGRVHYIHQHINPETRHKLEIYLNKLAVVVKLSKNKQDFEHKYQDVFYDNKQLEFDFDQE